MLEKIQIVKQRFDEVNDLIIQPDIIADQKRYIKLNKEYKDLKVIVDKGDVYKELLDNISEAEEIIADGSDDEMNDNKYVIPTVKPRKQKRRKKGENKKKHVQINIK